MNSSGGHMFTRPHIGRPSGASIGRTLTQHKQNEVGGQAKRSIEEKLPETTYPRINPTLQPLRDSFTLDLDQAFCSPTIAASVRLRAPNF